MKKIFVVILTILILFCSIALFPFNTFAAENDDNIDINIYLSGNPNTPLLSRSIPFANLINWNGTREFYLWFSLTNYIYTDYVRCSIIPALYYQNNNSVVGDLSTYSKIDILDEFNMGFSWDLRESINYVYDINNSVFLSRQNNPTGNVLTGFLISSTDDFNVSLCYNNIDDPMDNSVGEFVFNFRNYQNDDIYKSTVVFAKNITQLVGTSNWTCESIFFGPRIFINDSSPSLNKTSGLYMNIKNNDDDTYSNYFLFELSEYFMTKNGIYLDAGRQWIYPEDNIFNLVNYGITINPSDYYDFSIFVNEDYFDIQDLYVNLYNFNATRLYHSTVMRGVFIKYYLGFSFVKDTDGNLTGHVNLNMYYDTELASINFTMDVNNAGIEDFKGVNFKLGQSYIDVPYKGVEQDLIYYGTFYPTDTNNIFSLYLVNGIDLEEIRLDNSNNFIKDTENKLTHFSTSMNELEQDKNGYKAQGGYRVNQAVNDLQSTMNTFYKTAPEVNSIFNQIYDNQVILVMLTSVLSVALISYVLYGKKA